MARMRLLVSKGILCATSDYFTDVLEGRHRRAVDEESGEAVDEEEAEKKILHFPGWDSKVIDRGTVLYRNLRWTSLETNSSSKATLLKRIWNQWRAFLDSCMPSCNQLGIDYTRMDARSNVVRTNRHPVRASMRTR